MLCCLLPWLLSGCGVWNSVFHRSHDHRCTEKPFQGNTENLAGIRVPPGMTPPAQRNQVKIPPLNEPEHPRARTEPCLTQPPSYGSGASIALPTRTGVPMGAPAPAPVPVSPTEPATPEPPLVPPPVAPAAPTQQGAP